VYKRQPIDGTVDARSEKNIQTLHPHVRPKARALIANAAKEGIKIIVTSGTRSYEEQNTLFAQGRTAGGLKVTNARGGESNHNFGIAFDVTVFDGKEPKWDGPEYARVGDIGKSLGLEWGGDWSTIKDEPHFQLRPDWANGMSERVMLAELRSRVDRGIDAFGK
jgi:peptidoglycan L-alanyl-D-glutamate endopeptidase CwlK